MATRAGEAWRGKVRNSQEAKYFRGATELTETTERSTLRLFYHYVLTQYIFGRR